MYNYIHKNPAEYISLAQKNRWDKKSAVAFDYVDKTAKCVPVPADDLHKVLFFTVLRSTWSNKLFVDDHGGAFFGTSEPVQSPQCTLEDACVINAHKALVSHVCIPDSKVPDYFAASTLMKIGTMVMHLRMCVVLNVILPDALFEDIDAVYVGAKVSSIEDYHKWYRCDDSHKTDLSRAFNDTLVTVASRGGEDHA